MFTIFSCYNSNIRNKENNVSGDDIIYILPDGYVGAVYLLYEQNNGQSVKIENGNEVYVIPKNGILKLKSSLNDGWTNIPKFYYLNKNDSKTEIKYNYPGTKIKGDNLQVCCLSTGTFGKTDNHEAIIYLSLIHI